MYNYNYKQSTDKLSEACLENLLLKMNIRALWESYKSQQNEIYKILTDNQPLKSDEPS